MTSEESLSFRDLAEKRYGGNFALGSALAVRLGRSAISWQLVGTCIAGPLSRAVVSRQSEAVIERRKPCQ
jgi:hypothetical protein